MRTVQRNDSTIATEWEERLQKFLVDNPPPTRGFRFVRAMMIVERNLCEWALDVSGGNRAEGARKLGIIRTTFVEKIKRLFPSLGEGENGENQRDQGHRA